MDGASELLWTLLAIGTVDAVFVLWLIARTAKRGQVNHVVSSAELLGARARRPRL